MEPYDYELIGESLYKKTLENGLQVYLLPKAEMAKSYAIFMTNYGSIDRSFIPIDAANNITVPDGIAHFLEHKLFEKENRDVFSDFLGQGASPNAFTSFSKTAYLFSTTKNSEKNVETLIDFVQEPYFSDQSVEKEKGIIGQEIKMYNDQPDWQAFMGTIKNMFAHHPVNIDIAGTIDSIQQITKENLYTCYHTFYHPENMVLFIAGKLDPDKMMQKIEQNQAGKQFSAFTKVAREYPDEPATVANKESTLYMPVSIPKVTVGVKESIGYLEKESFLERDMLQTMLLDFFFSRSGAFYEQLYEEELIDDSFEYSTTVEKTFSFSLISTNTEQPQKSGEKIKSLLLSTNQLTLTEEELETMKRKRIGQILQAMNSLKYIANQYTHYHFAGIDFFEVIPFIQSLTVDRVNSFLQKWIEEERLTICVMEQQKVT